MTSGDDDEKAQAVLEGLSGLRRCPLCHERGFSEGMMHRVTIRGIILNGVPQPSDPGWKCNDCDFLMFDTGTSWDVTDPRIGYDR